MFGALWEEALVESCRGKQSAPLLWANFKKMGWWGLKAESVLLNPQFRQKGKRGCDTMSLIHPAWCIHDTCMTPCTWASLHSVGHSWGCYSGGVVVMVAIIPVMAVEQFLGARGCAQRFPFIISFKVHNNIWSRWCHHFINEVKLVKVTLSGSGGTWGQAVWFLDRVVPLVMCFQLAWEASAGSSVLPGMMLCYSFDSQPPLPPFWAPFLLTLACETALFEALWKIPLFLVTLFGSNIFLRNSPACIFSSAVLHLLGTVHSLDKHYSPYGKLYIYVLVCIQFLGLMSILKTSVSLPSRLTE